MFNNNIRYKKVFFISQHNLGIGDYAQIRKIADTLSLDLNYKVWHFSGGIEISSSSNSNIIPIQLPVISRIKPESGQLCSPDQRDIEIVHKERAEILLKYFKIESPDLLITGFFPFSKHRLEDTIMPLLEYIKKNNLNTIILSSIRDIPASDHGPFLQESHVEINKILKRYYNGVLYHTDIRLINPALIPFMPDALKDILIYDTGFISTQENQSKSQKLKFNYLITVGGGWDGRKIIEISCTQILEKEPNSKLLVICGPRMPQKDIKIIKCKFPTVKTIDHVEIIYTFLEESSTIISMAGCSTVPELIKHKKPCVLIPRENSFEQITRAKAYEKAGCLVCYELNQTETLTEVIKRLKCLQLNFNINLNGLENSIAIIKQLLDK